eukprot:scaffold3481_cov115-Cylindrotheca_fusiformis.AAC.5
MKSTAPSHLFLCVGHERMFGDHPSVIARRLDDVDNSDVGLHKVTNEKSASADTNPECHFAYVLKVRQDYSGKENFPCHAGNTSTWTPASVDDA